MKCVHLLSTYVQIRAAVLPLLMVLGIPANPATNSGSNPATHFSFIRPPIPAHSGHPT